MYNKVWFKYRHFNLPWVPDRSTDPNMMRILFIINYTQFIFQHSEADGLRILAFPCNQFGSQEPGTNEEIIAFVGKYGVQFDMFDKIDVNGNHAHPLYEYLKSKQGGTLGNFIKWNFTKFVINKEGLPVARFAPTDDPIPKVLEKCKSLF